MMCGLPRPKKFMIGLIKLSDSFNQMNFFSVLRSLLGLQINIWQSILTLRILWIVGAPKGVHAFQIRRIL